jgi:DNA polymerase (family 10)
MFREMADLLELQGGDRFRIRAYRGAARSVEAESESVLARVTRGRKALLGIGGIGPALAAVIEEIATTGRFPALERARRLGPSGIQELMRLEGIGARRATQLVTTLGIRTLDDLERAAAGGLVRQLPGFGPASERRLLLALEALRRPPEAGPRGFTVEYAEAFARYLRSIAVIEIAGGYRRRLDTIAEIDFLGAGAPAPELIELFVTYPGVAHILERGEAEATVRLVPGLLVSLRVVPEEELGAALYHGTGSIAHLAAVSERARSLGLELDRRGVFRGGRRVAARTEVEVLGAVGLSWIPPELREDRGEVEAAIEGRLPRLIELADVRGDLQCHTHDSDGRADLETMAAAARQAGREYLAVTDHSPALRIVGGLDAAGFRAQGRRIDELNGRLADFTILKAAEVDVLGDGTLDLDDATLAELDLVVVAIHMRLGLSAAEQTARLIRAVSHPSVDILAHPTGRIIGRREPMPMDFDLVCRVAVDHGVMLEVNAQPDRLDLDDRALRRAVELGARLVISTDAHGPNEFRYLTYGVDQARRGWATPEQVANTLPLQQFRRLLHGFR